MEACRARPPERRGEKTRPAHRLAGAHKRDARYSSHRAPHPAAGEGKLELTEAPRSTTVAEGIPEGFRSGLPWKGCRERRGSGGPHATAPPFASRGLTKQSGWSNL